MTGRRATDLARGQARNRWPRPIHFGAPAEGSASAPTSARPRHPRGPQQPLLRPKTSPCWASAGIPATQQSPRRRTRQHPAPIAHEPPMLAAPFANRRRPTRALPVRGGQAHHRGSGATTGGVGDAGEAPRRKVGWEIGWKLTKVSTVMEDGPIDRVSCVSSPWNALRTIGRFASTRLNYIPRAATRRS